MEIKFANTFEDYFIMHKFMDKRDLSRFITYNLPVPVCIIVTIWGTLGVYNVDNNVGITTLFAVLGIIMTIGLYSFAKKDYKYKIAKFIEDNPVMLSEKIVILEENKIKSIYCMYDNKTVELNIEDVYKVISTKNSIYIFSKKDEIYLIIPKKAFFNNEDMNYFLKYIKRDSI